MYGFYILPVFQGTEKKNLAFAKWAMVDYHVVNC
jgi:hypothetical protein